MPEIDNEASRPPANRKRTYVPTGRPRGRPKGSRNLPKQSEAVLPPVKPAAMRIPTAAKYLDVSESLIRKWLRQGRVQSVQIGAARLILVSSLDSLLVAPR
jgi:excisionase family DNA binding protein